MSELDLPLVLDKQREDFTGNAQEANRETLDELFINNEHWRQATLEKNPTFFESMKDSQSPRYLWIGCADSRVSAETICGLPPGSLFVHRNIANLVNNVDVSVMSIIQYAVAVLKVEHIVICGHYNCGGINAAMVNKDHESPLENWLRNIRDVYRLHQPLLDSIQDLEARRRKLVEVNVIEQTINLYKTRLVQKRRVETNMRKSEYGFTQPRVHPVVYDPGTGKLTRLDVQMRDVLTRLQHIYQLHSRTDEIGKLVSGMDTSMTPP